MQPVSKQRIGKHASPTIELLLETVFSIRSVQSGYTEKIWRPVLSHRTNIWPWVPAGPDAKSDRAGWLPAVSYCSALLCSAQF
jgi:hypothetical protein